MSVDIILKDIEWDGINKIRVPLEGGGTQDFSIGGGTPTLQTKTVTYTPTTSQQTDTISPDSGYDGLSLVNVIVNAMQGGADVPTFTLSGVQDGSTVTCDKTYAEVRALYDDGLLVALADAPTYNCVYAMSICDEPGSSSLRYAVLDANGYPMGDVLITSSAMTYSVPSVTQKTMNLPTATKGTVTNHTMTIGVGVANSRGFYASGVTRGNPIYVSASELVSGSETKTENGTYDVTNLAELVVNVSSGSDIPTFTVDTSTSPASVTCNKTYSECRTLYTNGDASGVATILPYNLKVTASVWDSDSSYLKYCLFNGYGYPVADLTYISSGITYSEPSGLVGIEGTPIATKGAVSNHSVSVTPSVTNSAGYISGGTKTGNAITVTATELASGNLPITQNADNINVVGYASVSVNVPKNLQTKTRTFTPTFSQQVEVIGPDSGYDGLNAVGVTVEAVQMMSLPRVASLTSTGTRRARIYQSNATQYWNIPEGYHTEAEYYEVAPLNVAPKIITANGSYSAGDDDLDGYSSVTVNVPSGSPTCDTKTMTNDDNQATSIQFTGLSGEPKWFFVRCTSQLTRSSSYSYYFVTDIRYNGSNHNGNYYRRSNGTYYNDTSHYSHTYSNGTLTVSSSANRGSAGGSFYNGNYELVYIY